MAETNTMAANDVIADADVRLLAPDLVVLDEKGAPRLIGGRCRACQALSFPRAIVCADCMSEDVEPVHLASEGTLYSFSIVHQAPKGWNVPYALGYVDLADGVRLLTHIDIAFDKLTIGMALRLSIGVVGADSSGAPLSNYIFTAS